MEQIIKSNRNLISSERLFSNSSVENLKYSKPSISGHIQEESLTGNNEVEIRYEEPQKLVSETFQESVNNSLKEDYIKFDTPKKPVSPNDVQEEPLFLYGMIEENLTHDRTIVENAEVYQKPQRPNTVQEETLFDSKAAVDYTPFIENFQQAASSIADNSLIEKYFDKQVKKNTKPTKKYVEKLVEASGDLQKKYCEIKDYIIKYKKVKTRISAKFETVKIGRKVLARFNVVGKGMRLYLNLDYIDVTTAYPNITVKNVTDKKTFEESPVLFKVKSDLSLKRACTLLDMVIAKFELTENPKFVQTDNMAEPKALYKALKASKKRKRV